MAQETEIQTILQSAFHQAQGQSSYARYRHMMLSLKVQTGMEYEKASHLAFSFEVSPPQTSAKIIQFPGRN